MHNMVSQTVKEKVAVLILGGGRGTRLYPLTIQRSKPAVPFAGRYRLVDIALSRCIHAGLLNLYVLTQYNSASLHLHINRTYRFDTFTNGSIEVLAASQSYMRNDNDQWFLGSADAVRKTLDYYRSGLSPYEHYLILAGDQIHEMDMEAMLREHLASQADFTIAATPIGKEQLSKYGVLQIAKGNRVTDFLEKPQPGNLVLVNFCSPAAGHAKPYWGSLGTYLIKAEILQNILCEGFPDFGSDVVPYAAKKYNMQLYPHRGFFEDIGNFDAFFSVHIALAESGLPINLYHRATSLYTYRRELPPAIFCGNASISKSLVVEGSVLGDNMELSSSLLGLRSIVQKNCKLYKTYVMGNDFYHCSGRVLQAVNANGSDLHLGIGADCQIANAIIDKNCYIGPGCRIGLEPNKLRNGDYSNYSIRNGIVIVPKGCKLAANTVI